MALRTVDRRFAHPAITHVDYKTLDMDRVLTAFLARLWHGGHPSRISRNFELDIDVFVREFLDHPQWFAGFGDHPDITRRWLETHLFDLVNRGRAGEAVAGPRPLHGFTYRYRNARHSRPYGADEHLYEMLAHARGGRAENALTHLREFFFAGIDPTTRRQEPTSRVDVETQALLRLTDQVTSDAADTSHARDPRAPLCIASADLLADDVLRLLFYTEHMPRSVLVDHLKLLLAFHLAMYHLRLLTLVPALVRHAGPTCPRTGCPTNPRRDGEPDGECRYQAALLVDVANDPDAPMATLAARSADGWYRRIPPYVRAHFVVTKLQEFADYQAKLGKLAARPDEGFAVRELVELLGRGHAQPRDQFAEARLATLLEESGDRDHPGDVERILQLGLPRFDTYIEILMAYRGDYHRRYIVDCLDSLLLKNRPGALLAQPRGGQRRFVLDSRLLEVLLQLAVLRPGGIHGFHTAALRVDELLHWLRVRYGLHVDRLPAGDGFAGPGIDERAALRANRGAFVERLREVGFYQDLSDAYVAQTVTPRYAVGEERSGSTARPAGRTP